jgi:hypothetical protein
MCRNASRRQRADVEKLGSAELIAAERKKEYAQQEDRRQHIRQYLTRKSEFGKNLSRSRP